MKLVAGVNTCGHLPVGNSKASDEIATTVMGTMAYLINGVAGKKIISNDVKTTPELTESAATFKISGYCNIHTSSHSL